MRIKLSLSLLVLAALLVAGHAGAGGNVHVLVLMENGLGTAAQAQPHLDKFLDSAKQKNGWDAAEGKYITSRSQGLKYIQDNKPELGILSIGAFLALRKDHKLAVLGLADVPSVGGRQYHLISKTAASAADCKAKTLASNHADDAKFIDKVVAEGAFKLGDFTLVATRRPVQTLKAVAKGEAVCALIDDAQYNELSHIEGTAGIKSVWKSKTLPPMPVVAFAGASEGQRSKFKASLGSLCSGDAKSYCDKVGIKSLKEANETAFEAVIKAYGG